MCRQQCDVLCTTSLLPAPHLLVAAAESDMASPCSSLNKKRSSPVATPCIVYLRLLFLFSWCHPSTKDSPGSCLLYGWSSSQPCKQPINPFAQCLSFY